MTTRFWNISAWITVAYPNGMRQTRDVLPFILDAETYDIRNVEDAERWGAAVVMTGDILGTTEVIKIVARPLYV